MMFGSLAVDDAALFGGPEWQNGCARPSDGGEVLCWGEPFEDPHIPLPVERVLLGPEHREIMCP